MKWKYKSLMFLILILFCVGGVCAVDPDNSTNVNSTFVNESTNMMDNINNTDLIGNITDNNSNSLLCSNSTNVNTNLNNSCKNLSLNNDTLKLINTINDVFKDKEVPNTVRKIMDESCTEDKLTAYYEHQLTKLTENIKQAFKTIDNDINRDLKKIFYNLKVTTKSLRDNAVKYNLTSKVNSKPNIVRLVNHMLKSIEGNLISINGYSKVLTYYLDEMDNYNKLKKMIANDTEISLIVDVDNSKDNLKSRLENLNTISNTLKDIRSNLNYILDNLDSMIKIIKNNSKLLQ